MRSTVVPRIAAGPVAARIAAGASVLVLAGCAAMPAVPPAALVSAPIAAPVAAGPATEMEILGEVAGALPGGRLVVDSPHGVLEVPAGAAAGSRPGTPVRVGIALQPLGVAPVDVAREIGALPATVTAAAAPSAFATLIGDVTATDDRRIVVDAPDGALTLPRPPGGCCADGSLVQVWTLVRRAD